MTNQLKEIEECFGRKEKIAINLHSSRRTSGDIEEAIPSQSAQKQFLKGFQIHLYAWSVFKYVFFLIFQTQILNS